MTAKCAGGTQAGSWDPERDVKGKPGKIEREVWCLVNSNIQGQLLSFQKEHPGDVRF